MSSAHGTSVRFVIPQTSRSGCVRVRLRATGAKEITAVGAQGKCHTSLKRGEPPYGLSRVAALDHGGSHCFLATSHFGDTTQRGLENRLPTFGP